MRETFTQVTYLAASVLFILGLKRLTKPDSARRGMQQAAFGMLLAIVGTLVQHEIVRYDWIIAGLLLGTIIGVPLGLLVPMIGLAFLIGIFLVLPIGGADMPVVISLLNSYAGLASSATGFAIGNNVLIIAGALDGASGFLLSILMSKAMNRSFANVLFGAFGSAPAASAAKSAEGLTVKSIAPEDAAVQLAFAKSVIVIPGYGL